MGAVNLVASVFVGLIAAAFLIGAVPGWLYGLSLLVATVIVSVGLYRQRHVIVGKNSTEGAI